VVREHLVTFRDLRRELPRHVLEAFESYLRCGIPLHGFARLQCERCHHERLLPFSCKGRICPSCNVRKMHDTAAHLVDRLLPLADYRQWVLSLPRRVRYLLVTRKELVSPVLAVFQQTLFAWQRRCARWRGIEHALPGSVTCIQRFGDALNLNLHFHSFLPDGVFTREAKISSVLFHPLAPPTTEDLDELAIRLSVRIGKKLQQLGAFEPDLEDDLDLEHLELGRAVAEQLVAFNDDEPFERKGLSAFFLGYSLHAGVSVEADDRKGLERILRYGLRPPFAEERLEEGRSGNLIYRLRKPLRDGRTFLEVEPLDLLRRLSVLIPPKGQNLTRYHGVFAPNSKHRKHLAQQAARLSAKLDPAPSGSVAAAEGVENRRPSSPVETLPEDLVVVRDRYLDWAALLKRVFEYDVTVCENCGGKVKVLAVITDPAVIRRILDHLHLPTAPPALARARAPPGPHLDDGPTIDQLCFDDLPEGP